MKLPQLGEALNPIEVADRLVEEAENLAADATVAADDLLQLRDARIAKYLNSIATYAGYAAANARLAAKAVRAHE